MSELPTKADALLTALINSRCSDFSKDSLGKRIAALTQRSNHKLIITTDPWRLFNIIYIMRTS
ncbi:TPA: hypothetical protein ACNV4Z_004172, partial [Enterobacter hormaechei]